MVFVNWMVSGLCLRISYSFIMFSLPSDGNHLTDTNTLFHLCVMSHGAVNYLFFLSGLDGGGGGGCNLKEIHQISNTRGCFPVFYFFNACASHVGEHSKKIKSVIYCTH